ncbi:cell wall hydrolase [Caulobacter sp. S45]|uniref:cell wall hydrolase n=1 Tax=Caulobacter sp. S45 TaxID=1641861 RepID=UPI0015773252|nr:cell wall hydrolase [Caulobacter sp. S45]
MDRVRRSTARLSLTLHAAATLALVSPQAHGADLGAPDLPSRWSATDPAAPLARGATSQTDERPRELNCLAQAVYYEAANQPLEGRQAVAQVVLNRLHHPSYPKSVCGVVYQGAPRRGCQFTFACDGSMARTPAPRNWQDAVDVAQRAMDGFIEDAVGASTHYHTLAVRPTWSAQLTPTVRIGAHQFYRFPGPVDAPGIMVASAAFAPGRLSAGRPSGGAGAPLRPGASAFSIWGLEVARVSPKDGGAMFVQSASGMR